VNQQGQQILAYLEQVAAERARRRTDPAMGERVRAVKLYQHLRFEQTYADMLGHPRYAKAARFFLEDLYGPEDYSLRDDQFARIVPALVRLFPQEIVGTVVALAELHALSERLDGAMATVLSSMPPDAAVYAQAWRTVGEPAQRERQIQLMLQVGGALERYTRNPLLRHSLRLMRAPAHAAGLGSLQAFLEKGFDTFREMRGAKEFLDTIATRERELAARLFAGGVAAETGSTG
jgi:hypothetical protein